MNKKILIFIIIFLLVGFPIPALEKNAIFYNKAGWQNLAKGETYKAILNFKIALKKNARFKKALLGLANAYLENKAYNEAYNFYIKVLNIEKENQTALIGLGNALTGMGKYKRALQQFKLVLKRYQQSIEAHFGIANLYYIMNNTLWAERKINTIFKINPFHYKTLILKSRLKSDAGRFKEAEIFIKKAMNARRDYHEVYNEYGLLLFKKYLKSLNSDYLIDSKEEFKRALSIYPHSINGHIYSGYISLIEKNYQPAIDYFKTASNFDKKNPILYYNIAVASEKSGNVKTAIENYVKAYNLNPSDNIIRIKLENFIIINNLKIGHPLRIGLAKKNYRDAYNASKKRLSDNAIYFFRRTLYHNPMHKAAREKLRDYYQANNYDRFYINELKRLYRLYSNKVYREKLNVAIIRRRNKLYYKEGYALELPPRDVPQVLVLNFENSGKISKHLLSGEIIANSLTYALQQLGRMKVVTTKKRLNLLNDNKIIFNNNQEIIKISKLINNNKMGKVDIIILGEYREIGNSLQLNIKLMNFNSGVIFNQFKLSERGGNYLSAVSLRAARKIFNKIPFQGRVLKIEDNYIIINLGKYDGIKKSDKIYIYTNSLLKDKSEKEKLLFAITDVDTLIASAKPLNPNDLNKIQINDSVYPIKKRKARLIE